MRFDNKQFEQNVSTTMSTLDKLKQKLNLSGASKGLENLDKTARGINLSGLSAGVETVTAKFSALQVMGMTALANITNSAVNAGKRIAASLTIEPIHSGWSEYELMLKSVQITMAGTGKTAGDVEIALKKLDEYADKTVYSTADMLNNLPKFTNAGIELNDATKAMIGIANATALAGGDANKASIAFYNLGQAIGTGYLTRMDYNSINNAAGIATMEWKKQMVEAAKAAGTLSQAGEDLYKIGDKSFTLQQLFIDGLQHQWATTEVMMKVFGDYGDETTEIGEKAYEASQNIRDFSMMMESLKATAGTGWKDTWQIVFGGLDESTTFWTKIYKAFAGLIESSTEIRNNFLGGVLDSKWDKLVKKINAAGASTEDFEASVKSAAEEGGYDIDALIEKHGSLEKVFQSGAVEASVLEKAIKGITGAADKAKDAMYDLSEVNRILANGLAGDDVKRIQEALNGLGFDLGEPGIDGIYGPITTAAVKAFQEANGLIVDGILGPDTLAALDNVANKVDTLADSGDGLKESYDDLIGSITEKGGKELILESLANVLEQLKKPLNAVKEAWKAVFGDVNMADKVYGIIEKIHELTEAFDISEETADNFQTTCEGLFALFQLGNSLFSTSLSAGLKIFAAVLQLFGTNLDDLGAKIADYIIRFRDWINEHTIFIDYVNKIANILTTIITGISDCINAFLNLDAVSNAVKRFEEIVVGLFGKVGEGLESVNIDNFCENIKAAFDKAVAWIKGLNDSDNIGKAIIDGIIAGLSAGGTAIWNAVVEIATTVITAFCDFLGIASPSKVFTEYGGNIIDGLINGLKNGASSVWDTLTGIASGFVEWIKGLDIGGAAKALMDKIKEVFSGIKFGPIIAAGIGIGSLVVMNNIAKAMSALATPLVSLGEMLGAVKSLTSAVKDAVKSYAKANMLRAIGTMVLSMAVAITLLAAALFILTKVPEDKLWSCVGALAVLAVIVGVLAGVAVLMQKFGGDGTAAIGIVAISAALLIAAIALQKLTDLDLTKVPDALSMLAYIMIGVMLLTKTSASAGAHASVAGSMLLKVAVALLIMVAVIKLMGALSKKEIQRGLGAIALLGIAFVALIAVSKLSGEHASKAGSMLIKMSIALLIMVGVIKLMATLDGGTLEKGMTGIWKVVGMFAVVMAASMIAGENAAKAGGMILMMAIALGIIVFVIKQLAEIDDSTIARGLGIIAMIGLIFAALIAVSHFAGENADKAGTMLLAMSASLLILVGVLYVLSLMIKDDAAGVYKALGVVSALLILFAVLIAATGKTQKCMGTLIMLTVVIILLAGVVVALSFLGKDDSLLAAGGALALVIVALAALMAALKFVSTGSGTINKSIGSLALLVLVVGLLGLVLAGISYLDIGLSINTVASIAALLVVMTGVLLVLSLIKTDCTKAVGALALIGLVVAEIGVVLWLLDAMDVNPSIETAAALSLLLLGMSAACLIVSMIPAAAALSGALGLAAFVGVMAGVLAILGGLSKIPGFNELIADGGETLGLIGKAIGDFVGNIVGGFMGSAVTAGLSSMAEDLNNFMTDLEPFLTSAANIDEKAVNGVKNIAEAMLILTGANLVEGLTGWLTGGSSISDFAAELPTLGDGMRQFADSLGTFTMSQVTSVSCACDAIKKLAEAASEIPNEGGWLGTIMGENGMGGFIAQMPDVASDITSFVATLGDFNEGSLNTVNNACDAILALANAASEIPNEGGWLGTIMGENGMGGFMSQMPDIADQLVSFAANLGDFNDSDVTTVKCACDAITALAAAAAELPNDGGWWGAIAGDNNIGDFGASLRTFFDEVALIDTTNIPVVVDTVEDIRALADAIKDIDFTGINTFGWSLSTLGAEGVTAFSAAFDNGAATVETAVTGMVDTAITAAKGKYESFSATGIYLVSGFAAGITSYTWYAEAMAAAMAKAAKEAAEEELGIASPSKVFYKIGSFTGQGFVNALIDYASNTYKAGAAMANSARSGLTDAISKIRYAIDSDMDMQPTIRPVLDLSDVRTGAAAIGGMLGVGQSVGVMTNVGAISTMMNQRRQNGATEDVVSAIDKLRKDLGKTGNTYNSINGVSYSEGDDVSEAIKVIVRAAKVERRN
jgi:hypothetical protein